MPLLVIVAVGLLVLAGFVLRDELTGAGGGEPVAVAEAGDHDPYGNDGQENPGAVGNAFDGDPSTGWSTSRYHNQPDLGGLKPGVGIWFQLEQPATVTGLDVQTSPPGASVEVYVGDGPPDRQDEPGDWGSLAGSAEELAADATVELDDATDGGVVLLWVTSLPETEPDRFQVEVTDVEVLAR